MTLINRLMAIALALASAATLAASPSADDAWEQLTRAQVKAELAAARASGTLVPVGEVGQRVEPATVSTASRAEIRAELAQARLDGISFDPDDASFAAKAATGEKRTRAEVRGETRHWVRNGSPRPEWHRN